MNKAFCYRCKGKKQLVLSEFMKLLCHVMEKLFFIVKNLLLSFRFTGATG